MPHQFNSRSRCITVFCLCVFFSSLACNRGGPPASPAQSGTKRYSLKGKVISVNQQAGNASIFNDPIPGFMDPMAMPYTIKPAAALNQLQPGDSISADVVVEPNQYWLENVQVTAHAQPPAATPAPQKDKKNR